MWRPRSDIGRLQYRDVILKQDEKVSSIRIHARTSKEGQIKSVTLGTVEDEEVCSVWTAYQFILKTATVRQTLLEDHTFFLTYPDSDKKQPTSVRPTTVANWIKVATEKAGIDTNNYQAHSIRAASSTKAVELGHSIKEVKNHANWSLNSNTFEQYYYKPSSQPLVIQFFLVQKSVSHRKSKWSRLEFV